MTCLLYLITVQILAFISFHPRKTNAFIQQKRNSLLKVFISNY
jgi:hypothetical protein